jgi:nucleoside-triphosphatase
VKDKKWVPGGFSTHAGLSGDFNLYISPFGKPPFYDSTHCVGLRSKGGAEGFPSIFDTTGVEILSAAQRESDLLCMDELGFLEKEAFAFQHKVLDCLDGPIPILGVIKEKRVSWHDDIVSHPSVRVIEVSLRNRSVLADEILAALSR